MTIWVVVTKPQQQRKKKAMGLRASKGKKWKSGVGGHFFPSFSLILRQMIKENNNKYEGSLEMASLCASATHIVFFLRFWKETHRAASDENKTFGGI